MKSDHIPNFRSFWCELAGEPDRFWVFHAWSFSQPQAQTRCAASPGSRSVAGAAGTRAELTLRRVGGGGSSQSPRARTLEGGICGGRGRVAPPPACFFGVARVPPRWALGPALANPRSHSDLARGARSADGRDPTLTSPGMFLRVTQTPAGPLSPPHVDEAMVSPFWPWILGWAPGHPGKVPWERPLVPVGPALWFFQGDRPNPSLLCLGFLNPEVRWPRVRHPLRSVEPNKGGLASWEQAAPVSGMWGAVTRERGGPGWRAALAWASPGGRGHVPGSSWELTPYFTASHCPISRAVRRGSVGKGGSPTWCRHRISAGRPTSSDTGEDAEREDLFGTAGGNAGWCGHSAKRYGGSSKN